MCYNYLDFLQLEIKCPRCLLTAFSLVFTYFRRIVLFTLAVILKILLCRFRINASAPLGNTVYRVNTFGKFNLNCTLVAKAGVATPVVSSLYGQGVRRGNHLYFIRIRSNASATPMMFECYQRCYAPMLSEGLRIPL